MVRVVMSEWHQIERRYGFDFDEGILSEIYPDMDEADIKSLLDGIASGETDVEQIIQDSYDSNVDIDWEWLDEDDMWTDRKGGYETTYEVSEDQTPVSKPALNPAATWPFPSAQSPESDDTVEITDEELAAQLDELKAAFDAIDKPSADTITIKIFGRGSDRGIGTITKAQYEYWKEHSDDLGEALNDNYDYDENETPEDARLPYEYYNEYEDAGFVSGPDEDSCGVEITDGDEETLYEGELYTVLEEIHGDEDSSDAVEEEAEMYLNSHCLAPGYYVVWAQGGKGTYFEGSIDIPEGEEFDPTLLKFLTTDFDGQSIITTVQYNGESIDNSGGDWWGKWADYQVIEITG
jgi:hypothetical protein